MVARLRGRRQSSRLVFPTAKKLKFDCVLDRLIKEGFLNKERKDGDLGRGKFVRRLIGLET